MATYIPTRLSVLDSLEEDISDDVEDDVFIRDGKFAKSKINGIKSSLMPPRKRDTQKLINNQPMPKKLKKRNRCWRVCEPFCYGFVAIAILIVLFFFAALLLTIFPISLQKLKLWMTDVDATPSPLVADTQPLMAATLEPSTKSTPAAASYNTMMVSQAPLEHVPCEELSAQIVWSSPFLQFNSECPLRTVDVNGDGLDDVIVGFGLENMYTYDSDELSQHRCPLGDRETSNIQQTVDCKGGVIAVDGGTGEISWQKWTTFSVLSLICNLDANDDGHMDCVVAGEGGTIIVLDSQSGEIIWIAEKDHKIQAAVAFNMFTVNTVQDLNGDNVNDIMAVHILESEISASRRIKFISGANGKLLRVITTPSSELVLVPLQLLTYEDGTQNLLVITGGQKTAGGLYTIRLTQLLKKSTEWKFTAFHKTNLSGFLVPAILTDINEDHIDDIIVSAFNSTIYAFNGRNFSLIWSYTFPASESVSSIVPGRYNHDDISDFLIKFNTGPGYPVYYYSQTTIINGRTGRPILEPFITDAGGAHSLLGGISISQTFGGDIFLHWQTVCEGVTDIHETYQFAPGSNLKTQLRADLCRLRFGTDTKVKLYAIARYLEPPGTMIFSNSDVQPALEKMSVMKKKSQRPVSRPNQMENERTNNWQNENKMVAMDAGPNEDQIGSLGYPPASYDDYEQMYSEANSNLRMRKPVNQYQASSRDVRSKLNADPNMFEINNDNVDSTDSITATDDNHKKDTETLWDLEMDKEEAEAKLESDYISRPNRQSNPNQRTPTSEYVYSVASTGVLLPSSTIATNTTSSIDFVFALNVYESTFDPTMLLPQEVVCIKEKMQSYRNNGVGSTPRLLEQKLAKECQAANNGKERPAATLPGGGGGGGGTDDALTPQLVLVRIRMQCACTSLAANEVCSRIEPMKRQRWTEYMGSTGNGVF